MGLLHRLQQTSAAAQHRKSEPTMALATAPAANRQRGRAQRMTKQLLRIANTSSAWDAPWNDKRSSSEDLPATN